MPEYPGRISPQAEERLISAVKSAILDVNNGADPNDAIVKVAEENGYGPDFVNRMIEMYNTSKTLSHFKHASADRRSSDFPIANQEAVISKLFPDPAPLAAETTKAASRDFMAIPRHKGHQPVFEKAAAYIRDGNALIQHALNKEADLKRAEDEARTKRAVAERDRKEALLKLASYFRQPGHMPFSDADTLARSRWGKLGELVMDAAWNSMGHLNTREKRGCYLSRPKICDEQQAPFNLVAQVIKTSEALMESEAEVSFRKEAREGYTKSLREKFHQPKGVPAPEKSAALFPVDVTQAVSTGLGGVLSKQMMGGDSASVLKKTLEEMTDPEHESRLRAIRSEALLQDLMVNDPVISRYDPADVVEAYSTFSQMAPKSSQQPAVIRGYLRRMLEGSDVLEPFEIQQLAQTEERMMDKKPEMPFQLPQAAVAK